MSAVTAQEIADLLATVEADPAGELTSAFGEEGLKRLSRALRRVGELEADLDAKHAKLVEVADKLREERARTDALVASLPKCGDGRSSNDPCGEPATMANSVSTDHERCDRHKIGGTQLVFDPVEHTWAAPLRAVLDARKTLPRESSTATKGSGT